ncbi:helix-turn-helix domain-containing protein, partial [Mycolicibacterium sp.]|uniref:helix-turn-helix domain-containing protein n=1 Tax=Mycolicibacterium sp. TaxID=2320850 RepID=UPI003D14E390
MSLQRHDADAAPDRAAGRQRQNVLGVLREAAGPVDVPAVAERLQIHVTTARFHLAALESQGY